MIKIEDKIKDHETEPLNLTISLPKKLMITLELICKFINVPKEDFITKLLINELREMYEEPDRILDYLETEGNEFFINFRDGLNELYGEERYTLDKIQF